MNSLSNKLVASIVDFEWIMPIRIKDLPVVSMPQYERPWGTGHAVWAAKDAIKGSSFAVINADDY